MSKSLLYHYFSWPVEKQEEFRFRVMAFPCLECGGSGECVMCGGRGCVECEESPDWGDCSGCDGRGDFFHRIMIRSVFYVDGYAIDALGNYKKSLVEEVV